MQNEKKKLNQTEGSLYKQSTALTRQIPRDRKKK
jgi:hypothetical protein